MRSADEIYDELLVTRCRRRDAAAWNELVDRYHARLLFYVRRFVDDEERAGSVLQDVWLSVLRGIPSLREGSRLAPWMYTIARRAAMNHFRDEYARREEPEITADVESGDPQDDGQLPFDNAELVHYGLGRIGPAEREVLTLYFLEDLSLGEIGDVLGVPVGTVKSRLFKARRDLKLVLDRETKGADNRQPTTDN
jgi:RNA polymerase sigma-70 factor (ECF subfamily)